MDEDHHHHYTNNMADLRQLIHGGGRAPPPHFPSFARNLPFDIMMAGRQLPLHDLVSTTTDHHHSHTPTPTTTPLPLPLPTASATTNFCGGLEADAGCVGGDGATGRWPRQETLTLLDIRSRLDPKFKEANHKGPLWDEVSRIMCEEHGYQRSGKKCREKFENLYKYYKKTKEGKAGRQDGKHYRFFRQLEALYGDAPSISMINPASFHGQEDALKGSSQKLLCDVSLSLSNSSELDTSSEEEDDNGESKGRKRGRGWKAKIKDFIGAQMRKLMEKQEVWLEKMMRTMEQKEHERAVREEQWRSEEAARVDRERKLWAKERAWIESRDSALVEILDKIKGNKEGFKGSGSSQEELNNENGSEIETLNATKCVDQGLGGSDFNNNNNWSEPEITRLIQLRSSLESRLNNSHNKINEELMWEEIGAKMSCYGYERSGSMCKEKWDAINYYLIKKTKEECNKKRKDNSRSNYNFHNNNDHHGANSLYNSQGQGGVYSEIINEQGSETARLQPKNEGSSPSSSNAGNVVQDSCFRFLMGDNGDQQHGLWESYGLKLNNGENR